MHLHEARYFDFFIVGGVVNHVTLANRALVHAHVGQLTVTTFVEFERQCHEWFFGIALEYDLFFVFQEIEADVFFL